MCLINEPRDHPSSSDQLSDGIEPLWYGVQDKVLLLLTGLRCKTDDSQLSLGVCLNLNDILMFKEFRLVKMNQSQIN